MTLHHAWLGRMTLHHSWLGDQALYRALLSYDYQTIHLPLLLTMDRGPELSRGCLVLTKLLEKSHLLVADPLLVRGGQMIAWEGKTGTKR
jgi:hypothetical protein